MSNLDDTFGPFPGRPDHPDMEILSELVIALDSVTETPDFDFSTFIGETVDIESLIYLGVQRSLRMFPPGPILERVSALYCDAFLVGVEYGKRLAAKASDAATVAEVFGDEPTD